MARADRLQAGDPFISAGNLNKVIEQANRLDAAQGGQGLGVTNDETGFLVQNLRRRLRPDGESPYDSSDPWRRTLRRNTSGNRHKHELEMWNSTAVTGIAKAYLPASSNTFPPTSHVAYGVPALTCIDSSLASSVDGRGSGELAWHQMDGDFPFCLVSSGDAGPLISPHPQRKTLRRRNGTTIYRNTFELYNSQLVSDNRREASSSVPAWYGIPFLPVDEDGSGGLMWNILDADRLGTAGPRSLERFTTSGLDVFQLYDFDAVPVTLSASDIFEFVVRRNYGTSTANHYIQYLNSSALANLIGAISLPSPGDPKPQPPSSSSGEIGTSDKAARADHAHPPPRWDVILNAKADTYMLPDDVSSSRDLYIGAQSFQEWRNINMWATDLIEIKTVESGGTTTIGNDPGHLMTITSSEIRVHNVASPILNLDTATGALHVNGAQIVSARLGAISAPSGGSTIDAEARVAINLIISRMTGHGLIAST